MEIIIRQIFINMLKNITAGKQCFQFFSNGSSRVINKGTDNGIITGIFPVTDRSGFRILLKIPEIIHHIPGAVNIESTKMIAVIPLLHGRCFICKICRKEKLVDFMLNKAKIFIQSGIGNCIRDKVICSCKDTFFCNFQTSCDNSKVKRWIIF